MEKIYEKGISLEKIYPLISFGRILLFVHGDMLATMSAKNKVTFNYHFKNGCREELQIKFDDVKETY